METMASLWACDPGDLGGRRHEPWTACEFPPAAPLTWTEPLAPHLHRNKQLQDTLLQREEELQRLQDENQELRRFLSSAFVRNLEHKVHKVQRVAADGRKLKRNLMNLEDLRTRRPLLVSKRVCRNLTARLNSASPEAPASPEPDLDLWVLRTLGLKDRDTIDTSSQSSSDLGLRALVYHTLTPSSSPGQTHSSTHSSTLSSPVSSAHSCTLSSTHSSAISSTFSPAHSPPHSSGLSSTFSPTFSSTFSSAPSYCPRVTPNPDERPEANCQTQTCTAPPGGRTATGLNGLRGGIRTPPTLHPDLANLCTATAPSPTPAAYWSPSWDSAHFSPPAERLPVSPRWSSAWLPDRPWTPASSCTPTSPPAATSTPRGRTDVAFRMSLSPSSSVKTHSFPQGQAFTCKHLNGRWNFTWVPRQEP